MNRLSKCFASPASRQGRAPATVITAGALKGAMAGAPEAA